MSIRHTPDSMQRPIRLLCALLPIIVLAVWLAWPRLTLAHAKLISSEPASGAVLDSPPATVKLYFTEDVGLEFSTARLLDRTRKEHIVGTLAHEGANTASLVVPLPQDLADGGYTLIWRVVSGIDGHLTLGTLSFHIGPIDPNQEPFDPALPTGVDGDSFTTATETPDPLRWLVRAALLAAATLLLGGSIFTVLVIEPSATDSGQAGDALWRSAGVHFAGIAAWAAAILILALALDLLAQVALITGTDYLGAAGRGDTMLTLLNSTRFGFAWIMKAAAAALLLLLMVLVWAFNKRGGSGLWEIGIAAGSLLLLAESLSSHAAAAVNSGQLLGLPVPLISDWLHLVTVATWIGGLGYMVLALFPTFRRLNYDPETRRVFLGKSIPRFSRLAVASVALLAITGTYNLVVHSTDLGAILGSTYGQVLALKIIIFAALVGLGAVNLRRLSPLLRATRAQKRKAPTAEEEATAAKPVAGLWRNIRLETALASVALVCAGGLTLLPPPTEGSTGTPGTPIGNLTPTPVVSVVSSTQTVAGSYALTMRLARNAVGDELTLDIARIGPASTPLTDVSTVLIRVTPQDGEAGSTAFEATPVSAIIPDLGAWQAKGAILPLDGRYVVNVTARRTESNDLRAAFAVTVAEGSAPAITPTTALQVRVITEPSPPVSGTVGLNITLLDGEGKPLEGARVSVAARRPASQDAPVAGTATPVADSPGAYTTSLELRATGSWLLLFTVEREGLPTLRSDASIDVGE
jgi:copper transport protein